MGPSRTQHGIDPPDGRRHQRHDSAITANPRPTCLGFCDLTQRPSARSSNVAASAGAGPLAAGAGYADENLVFSLADGRPHNPNTFADFDDGLRRTVSGRIRLHDLRHTWATLALAEGVHPRVVQERLGHSSLGDARHHSHVTPGLKTDAAQRVAVRLPPTSLPVAAGVALPRPDALCS